MSVFVLRLPSDLSVPEFNAKLYCICLSKHERALRQMEYKFSVIYETLSSQECNLLRKAAKKKLPLREGGGEGFFCRCVHHMYVHFVLFLK